VTTDIIDTGYHFKIDAEYYLLGEHNHSRIKVFEKDINIRFKYYKYNSRGYLMVTAFECNDCYEVFSYIGFVEHFKKSDILYLKTPDRELIIDLKDYPEIHLAIKELIIQISLEIL
jgi:hypothetical protein